MFAIQILVFISTANSQYYPYYLGYGTNSNSNYGGIGSSVSTRPSTYYNPYNWPNYQTNYNPGTYTNSYGGSGGWNGITFPQTNYGGSNYGIGNYGNVGSYYGLGYGFANYNPWQYYWGYGDRKK